ncbi:DUF1080 domain-containing protein [Akkermansiaceae bacterium]|nr:DUF1080 domain-containing protein [Akkermansiaceae bacterium]
MLAVSPDEFIGGWAIQMANGDAGWLLLSKQNEQWGGEFMWVGNGKGLREISYADGQISFLKSCKVGAPKFVGGPPTGQRVPCLMVAEVDGKKITVTMTLPSGELLTHSGFRLPPMPLKPDLTKVEFGEPISLFNGKDLTGWKLSNSDQINGWSVVDGVLENSTPKMSFDPFSRYGNLRTEQAFSDGLLTIEFKVPEKGNSGIYVRGAYEAQVVDRDSKMQGINGIGAIFGRVAPRKNAGKVGGEWQKYEITIIDRHASVVLNGEKVIDNEPVIGNTNGAYQSDITKPGPLYLQGDHTAVSYRNIVFQPRVQKKQAKVFQELDLDQNGMLTESELPKTNRGDFHWADLDLSGGLSEKEAGEYFSFWKRSQEGKKAISKTIKIHEDLFYVEDGHPRQKLDLYLPERADETKPLPLVVWIHGGGWQKGTKEFFHAQPEVLKNGFALASVNYRLTNHAQFPAQIHDCKAAIRYLRAHASIYGIDPEQIGVWGSSAGGHLVALLGTSADVKELEGDLGVSGVSSRVQAVCDYFGPSDLVEMGKNPFRGGVEGDAEKSPISKLLGGAIHSDLEKARQASPVTYISADDPPFLILHGDQDPLVPLEQSTEFDRLLKEAEVSSAFLLREGKGHRFFNSPEEVEAVVNFFKKTLQ